MKIEHLAPECTCNGKVCRDCGHLKCWEAFSVYHLGMNGRREVCISCMLGARPVYSTSYSIRRSI